MSKTDSGLGWLATSEYVCMEANALLASMQGRDFTKIDSTASLVFLNMYTGTYRHPALLSTNADAVRFKATSSPTFSYTQTFNIDGVTWYYNKGEYGFMNGTYSVANYPTFDEFNLYSSNLTEAQIRRLLEVAGVQFGNPYIIQFNANGGSGTMEDQSVNVDEYDNLSPCTFTKTGYDFIGWATSSGGSVVYTDGQQIYNIAEGGETVVLYAVWSKTQLKAQLYTNKSPKNMLTKDKTLLASANIVLKNSTDILEPVFVFSNVSDEIIAATNYIYVPALGRFYFVNKIESIKNSVWAVTCRVDVLSSWDSAIREQYAIIKRQEEKYNTYVNDGVFRTYQYSNIETFPYTQGFSTLQYVLMVAGN